MSSRLLQNVLNVTIYRLPRRYTIDMYILRCSGEYISIRSFWRYNGVEHNQDLMRSQSGCLLFLQWSVTISIFGRRLEYVLKMPWIYPCKTSLKCLQKVLDYKKLLRWRCYHDIFKMSSKRLRQDECLLGWCKTLVLQ